MKIISRKERQTFSPQHWLRIYPIKISLILSSYERCCKRQPSERLRNVERILKVTKKSGNRERDVGCCLYETDNLKNETISRITTFTRLMDYNNGFSISSFFLSFLSFLWIGAQFPQEKFLSYGRILTLHYYFLLMCILFSILFLEDTLLFFCHYNRFFSRNVER